MRGAAFRTMTPAGLVIETVMADPESVLVSTRAVAMGGACPSSGTVSTRVHSRYYRRLLDMPPA